MPRQLSQTLADDLRATGKPVELYTYPADDHSVSRSFALTMSRSVAFFDRYLKG